MTFDQVAPGSIVASNIGDPELWMVPTCSGTALEPVAQHWFFVGNDKPKKVGSGAADGNGSGVQESPPSRVETIAPMNVD